MYKQLRNWLNINSWTKQAHKFLCSNKGKHASPFFFLDFHKNEGNMKQFGCQKSRQKQITVSAQSSLHAAHFNSLCAKKMQTKCKSYRPSIIYMKFKINYKCLLHISNEPTSLINSNALVFLWGAIPEHTFLQNSVCHVKWDMSKNFRSRKHQQVCFFGSVISTSRVYLLYQLLARVSFHLFHYDLKGRWHTAFGCPSLFPEGCQGLPVCISYLIIFHQLIVTENNKSEE